MSAAYFVNEIFYSPQGEGLRAGTANVFVRFRSCNLRCSLEPAFWRGEVYQAHFDCDTEFESGRPYSLPQLLEAMAEIGPPNDGGRACILTGGEPSLQVDEELIRALRAGGWYIAIETNGTRKLPDGIDWITLSPKTAFHTIRQEQADEFKIVRQVGQELPPLVSIPVVHRQGRRLEFLVSPAWEADGTVRRETLEWCIELVKKNPAWRLSCQQHKWWRVR